MRALRLLFVSLVWTLLAADCTPTRVAPNPALWRIADADSEIWLFGTVHVLPRGLAWRSAPVSRAFAQAETIVFEADLGAAQGEAFNALVRSEGLLPAHEALSASLDAAQRARLTRVAAALGVDAAVLERTRPWLAALQLSLAYAQREGADPAAGVETVLGAEARAARKRFAYFETPEMQIQTLARLSPAAQTAFLTATLRQIEEDGDVMDQLDRAWVSGDAETLARLVNRDIAEAGPEAYAALITRRNRDWAGKIATMLKGRGRVFIAVGAAHLVGRDSVVALLRARGVSVEGP